MKTLICSMLLILAGACLGCGTSDQTTAPQNNLESHADADGTPVNAGNPLSDLFRSTGEAVAGHPGPVGTSEIVYSYKGGVRLANKVYYTKDGTLVACYPNDFIGPCPPGYCRMNGTT